VAKPTEVGSERQTRPVKVEEHAIVIAHVGTAFDVDVTDAVQWIRVIIQRIEEHWNFAIVESHDPCACEIDGEGIASRDDEALWTRIASHRTIALSRYNPVDNTEVFPLRLIMENANPVAITKRSIQIQHHPPRRVVPIPISRPDAIFPSIPEDGLAQSFGRAGDIRTKRAQLREISLERSEQSVLEAFRDARYFVLVSACRRHAFTVMWEPILVTVDADEIFEI